MDLPPYGTDEDEPLRRELDVVGWLAFAGAVLFIGGLVVYVGLRLIGVIG